MSTLNRNATPKVSNHNERSTADTYGSTNQAAGQAMGGVGQYEGPVGKSGFDVDQINPGFGVSETGKRDLASGDISGSGTQAGGLAMQGGGAYPGRVGVSHCGNDLGFAGSAGTGDSYGSGNQAAGQAMQGGGQYPGKFGESHHSEENLDDAQGR